jgi:hypothetical protein
MKRASGRRTRTASSVRQSVAIPVQLAVEVERVARANLGATYRRFMTEADPERKNEAGKDLIRAIFGKDASAGDPLL